MCLGVRVGGVDVLRVSVMVMLPPLIQVMGQQANLCCRVLLMVMVIVMILAMVMMVMVVVVMI